MESEGRPLSFTTPDGLSLGGVSWGRGAGSVVFTPGNGFPVQCYRPALDSLLEHAEVHGLNPRGLGGSEVPADFSGWEPLLDDLRAFISERLEPPVVAAGHSLGAMLSLWLAAEAPELVQGLLLLDPLVPLGSAAEVPEGGSQRERELIVRTRARRDRWSSRQDAARSLRGKGGYQGWRDDAFEAFLAAGLVEDPAEGVRLACPPWLECRIYETLPRKGVWDWARRARAPAVVLRGEDSEVADAEALEELTSLLPMAAVVSVKGDHAFAQQHPAATGEALGFAWRFLMRCASGGEVPL